MQVPLLAQACAQAAKCHECGLCSSVHRPIISQASRVCAKHTPQQHRQQHAQKQVGRDIARGDPVQQAQLHDAIQAKIGPSAPAKRTAVPAQSCGSLAGQPVHVQTICCVHR